MTTTTPSVFLVRPLESIVRPLISLVVALVVTICLFWVMQYLIETADRSLNHEATTTLLEFVRVERDETPDTTRVEKPERPDKPDEQPPQPQLPRMDDPNANVVEVSADPVQVELAVEVQDGFNLGSEGDYLPIVKVAPIYPNRALSRGIEGFCVVEYTVTRLGTIKDPMVVKDQCSSTLFYASSVNATMKFKYKPRVVSGVEVEVPGVRNKFTFNIDG